ncbi:hypothetical protein [Amycolatopsis rubida]|uniref:Uncharacterized protein n=1 Tax=Amycolatopsis rubida TaxID=112413 RepID=A0A1I5X7G2_9PSEU|nr:hypothetical protein [Amycolatopsis rubida]SFQ27821.1 hypothetical protein SAMN05421854_11073 [Amycolatopsis rubida]
MNVLSPEKTAAAAKQRVQRARADYDRAQREFAQLGDSADLTDVGWLDGRRQAWVEAVEAWHACAPGEPAGWWPGGWRVRRRYDGRIETGVPRRPWASRDEAAARIAAATADEPLLRDAAPVWIAIDQADYAPVALDADYWASQQASTR